ncbi:oligosaccharide flippase family protein [Sinomonas albida]|uniref:oligosaccharide flippase family protein n=1 Tax=Sinomonas albida TaxID=369942 RepID=UPI003019D0E7
MLRGGLDPGATALRGRASGQRPATASRAFALSLLNTVISKFGTIAIGVLLARLLGPAQFGTYAIALVALLAVLSFNELGVSLAIVRWPSDPAEIAPTVTTISVGASALILGASWAGAPAFAAAMGDPAATDVVRAMAVCVLINGLVATPAALLQRDFRQGVRLIIDQVNVWLGAIVSVVLVASGVGAMSLAVGRIVASLVAAVLFIAYSPLPLRFGWRQERVRPLLRFGLPLAGSSVIAFAVGYADQIVAGNLLGSLGLGFYVLAANLANWPVNIFSQPLRGVAPPVFAKLQHDPQAMREAFLSLVGVTAAAVLPVVTVMAVAALPLVSTIYGAAWAASAQALVWLAATAGLRIFFELVYDFLVVLGESGAILWVQCLWIAGLVPALAAGARLAGIAGLAFASLAEGLLIILPVYLVLLARRGFRLGSLLQRTWLPLAACVPLAGVTLLLRASIDQPFLALCASAGCGAVVMGALVVASRRDLAAIRSWGHAAEVRA